MWYKDTKEKYWLFFKGDNYHYGWNIHNEWEICLDKDLKSFDAYEVPCTNKDIVEKFIEEAGMIGVELQPFDIDRINLLKVVNESFDVTINNLQYEIRNSELNKLI